MHSPFLCDRTIAILWSECPAVLLGPERDLDCVLVAWSRATRGVAKRAAQSAAVRAAEESLIAPGFPKDEAALDRIATDAVRPPTG
jgi:hypothetical protein